MQKRLSKLLLSLAIVSMLVTLCAPTLTVNAALRTYSDLRGHWAAGPINQWNSLGLIGGYADGTFGVSRPVTKAEFITFVNRAFGYTATATINFSDVKPTNWFAGDIAKAIAAGYISGNADGTFKPNQPLSRLEAARVLYKIMRLEPGSANNLAQYTDIQALSAEDKAMVNAVVGAKYFGGYPDKTLRPQGTITRAEMIVILSRAAGTIMNVATTFGPETGTRALPGNATITKSGTVLQNTIVSGDLYITEGVGDGDFYLKNVRVLGRAIVAGGGSHSGHVEGESALPSLLITYPNGNTRLVVVGSSTVGEVQFLTPGIVDLSGNAPAQGLPNATIDEGLPAGSIVQVIGHFAGITVNAPGVTLQVGEGSQTENITVSETAAGSNLQVSGTVTGAVTVNAPETSTTITGSVAAVTTTSTAAGSGVTVQGSVTTLTQEAPQATTTVATGASVSTLTTSTTATGSTVTVQGTVAMLSQNAPQATTTVAAGATVSTLTAGAAATGGTVNVQGTVSQLQASAPIAVTVETGGSLPQVALADGAAGTAITTGEGVTAPAVTAPPELPWVNDGEETTGSTTPTTPPSGGDGGGGPVAAVISGVSVRDASGNTISGVTYDSSTKTVSLAAVLDSALVNNVVITTSPSGANLTATKVIVYGREIARNLAVTSPNPVSLADLLGEYTALFNHLVGVDFDGDVSLGTVRALLGEEVSIQGTVDGTAVTITVQFGPQTTTATVSTSRLDAHIDGQVITATVKVATKLDGNLGTIITDLTSLGFGGVFPEQISVNAVDWFDPLDPTDLAGFKAALVSEVGVSWATMTLEDLKGDTIYFRLQASDASYYTVNFNN